MVFLLATHHASAQPAPADGLSQEGMALMARGDYQGACPKLDESFRRVPATEVLLALAMCHEKQGRLLAAWSEYNDVAYRFMQEGQQARADAARKNADTLYPRLSRLTLKVDSDASAVEGFEVRRDGLVVEPAAWNTSVPVDAGQHRIEVGAPGRESWSTTVAVGPEGDRRTVEIPVFRPSGVPPAQASVQSFQSDAFPSGAPRLTTLQTVGVVTAGAGVLSVALGAYFAIAAISGKSKTDAACPNDACFDAASFEQRQDAARAGNRATVAWVAGGLLVATGATLFIVGRPGPSHSGPQARLAPQMGSRDVGVVLLGNF